MQSPCSFSVECYCPPRRNLYIGSVEGPFSLEFIANLAEKFSLAPTPVHLQTGLWGLRVSHFFGGKGENLFPLEEFISRSSINPWVKVYASKHVMSCWVIVAIFFFFPPFSHSSFSHILKERQPSHCCQESACSALPWGVKISKAAKEG